MREDEHVDQIEQDAEDRDGQVEAENVRLADFVQDRLAALLNRIMMMNFRRISPVVHLLQFDFHMKTRDLVLKPE